MHINVFLIPVLIFLGLILLGLNDSSKNRKLYIILSCAILLFVAAMRSPEYMTRTYSIDTLNYKWSFERIFDMSWADIWNLAKQRYMGSGSEDDIGFLGLQKLISLFTHDFHIYSLLADSLFFVPFGILLYRYTTSIRQLIFAFVFYVSLMQIYFFGGARQIFAIGFDLMALLALLDRKKFLSFMFFFAGISIHFSSILFAVPLLLIWLNLTPKSLKLMHLICLILFPIIWMIPDQIIMLMGNAVGMERYASYGDVIHGGATTFIILIELLSLLCLVAIKGRDLLDNATIRKFYVMAPLFTILAPLIRADGSMIRVSLYYFMFLTLLVPYALDCMFTKRDRTVVYIIAIGALSYLTLAGGGTTYYFFWQY